MVTSQSVPYCAPFGDTKETRDRLVRDFIEGLKGRFPSRIARRLPSSQEAGKLFDRTYRQALATEFLKLTGAPSHLVEALSPAPLASRLGATIHKIATAGAFRGIAKNERPPDRLQKYDIGEILARLADARWPLVLASRSNGSSGPREKRLFQRLSNLYQQFMREIRARAARSHISPAALMEFVRLNVRRRNANRPLLYRWKTMRNNARLAKAVRS